MGLREGRVQPNHGRIRRATARARALGTRSTQRWGTPGKALLIPLSRGEARSHRCAYGPPNDRVDRWWTPLEFNSILARLRWSQNRLTATAIPDLDDGSIRHASPLLPISLPRMLLDETTWVATPPLSLPAVWLCRHLGLRRILRVSQKSRRPVRSQRPLTRCFAPLLNRMRWLPHHYHAGSLS